MVAVHVLESRPGAVGRVRTSRAVSAEEWGGAAALAGWIQSRGGCPVPTSHVGLELSTSSGSPTKLLETSLSSASAGWWREGCVAFLVHVGARSESSGRVEVTVGDGATTLGTFSMHVGLPAVIARSRIFSAAVDLTARGGEIDLVVEAYATISGVVVDLVQVVELPRSLLELDALDRAVLPASCDANAPIQDNAYLSARGAVDAYLYADARRQGFFHACDRDNPILVSGALAKTELFPFGIPLLTAARAPGDATRDDVVVAIEASFDDAGDATNKAILYVDTDEGGSALSASPTGASWATYLFRPEVVCEDLSEPDGLPGSVFERLRIYAESPAAGTGTPVLKIGTISVFSTNAEAEKGFSASNYYAAATTDTIPGSDAMTQSVMFRVDSISGFQTVWSKRTANSGWRWLLTNTGAIRFEYADGTTQHQILSGVLTAGRTYVATASWDGTNLRLVVGQTAATPVAGGAGYSAAAIATSIGAASGGGLPAPGLSILGLAASSTVALSDAQMQAHNAVCAAVGDMRPFGGCEHLFSARFGLHADLLGADTDSFTLNGTTTLERLAPRMG